MPFSIFISYPPKHLIQVLETVSTYLQLSRLSTLGEVYFATAIGSIGLMGTMFCETIPVVTTVADVELAFTSVGLVKFEGETDDPGFTS